MYSYDLSSFLYVDFATIKLTDGMSVRGLEGQKEKEREGIDENGKKKWRILSALYSSFGISKAFFDLINGQYCKFYVCFNRLCILI